MKISINAQQWLQLDDHQHRQIEEILNRSFPDFRPVKVVPVPDGPTIDTLSLGPTGVSVCKLLCGVAEASAVAACQLLPNPIAVAACVAAAKAAGALCEQQCVRLGSPPPSSPPLGA